MRLLDAILDANRRALNGDKSVGIHPEDFNGALPLIALTCIDARLNPLMPEVLGVPEDKFIWLRNSGNIIFEPMSSMTRTLAMACAIKQGREIVIIGHTDCLVRKTSTLDLTERFRQLGVDRSKMPDNLNEFFGLFASERQNVIRSCGIVRSSPLIGPKIPVHGLMVDIETGKLEWVVNGYEELERAALNTASPGTPTLTSLPGENPATIGGGHAFDVRAPMGAFQMGEMKFPEMKIGDHGSPDSAKPIIAAPLPIGEGKGDTQFRETKWQAHPHPKEESRREDANAPIPFTQPVPKSYETIGNIAQTVQQTAHEVRELQQAAIEKVKEVRNIPSVLGRIEKAAEVVSEVASGDTAGVSRELVAKIRALTALNRRISLIGTDQKRYGPVPGEKIVQWLREGRIDGSTPAQLEGTTNWQPLSMLPDHPEKLSQLPLPPKYSNKLKK